jgi:hypothetical protein
MRTRKLDDASLYNLGRTYTLLERWKKSIAAFSHLLARNLDFLGITLIWPLTIPSFARWRDDTTPRISKGEERRAAKGVDTILQMLDAKHRDDAWSLSRASRNDDELLQIGR